ncbi:hypothetical protein FA13DRAFT_1704355 [Coprinellus micaceus]|uniref:Uncharacterized protein n=1 Tax=Coprinellus micaceus TaxID=71717 RepID=A0A4Y7TWQ6_COPMI|nr:hypothetical protein FA13DRAFT_1704355 [Coprinellus micaceus]
MSRPRYNDDATWSSQEPIAVNRANFLKVHSLDTINDVKVKTMLRTKCARPLPTYSIEGFKWPTTICRSSSSLLDDEANTFKVQAFDVVDNVQAKIGAHSMWGLIVVHDGMQIFVDYTLVQLTMVCRSSSNRSLSEEVDMLEIESSTRSPMPGPRDSRIGPLQAIVSGNSSSELGSNRYRPPQTQSHRTLGHNTLYAHARQNASDHVPPNEAPTLKGVDETVEDILKSLEEDPGVIPLMASYVVAHSTSRVGSRDFQDASAKGIPPISPCPFSSLRNNSFGSPMPGFGVFSHLVVRRRARDMRGSSYNPLGDGGKPLKRRPRSSSFLLGGETHRLKVVGLGSIDNVKAKILGARASLLHGKAHRGLWRIVELIVDHGSMQVFIRPGYARSMQGLIVVYDHLGSPVHAARIQHIEAPSVYSLGIYMAHN